MQAVDASPSVDSDESDGNHETGNNLNIHRRPGSIFTNSSHQKSVKRNQSFVSSATSNNNNNIHNIRSSLRLFTNNLGLLQSRFRV